MKKIIILIILLSILLSCGNGNNDNQNNPGHESQLEVEDEIAAIEVFGVVKSLKSKNINLDFRSKIEKIHVVPGQIVKQNDPLISLNLDYIKNQINAKEHSLNTAKLELKRLQQEYARSNTKMNSEYQTLVNSIKTAEAELIQLQNEYDEKKQLIEQAEEPEVNKLKNQIDNTNNELSKAETELENKKILFTDAVITQNELNEYESTVEKMRIDLKNLKLSLEQLQNTKQRELDQLELQIVQKGSALKNLKIQLDNLATPEITNIEIQRERVASLLQELQYLQKGLTKSFLLDDKIVLNMKQGIIDQILVAEGDYTGEYVNIISIIDLEKLVIDTDVPEEFIIDIHLKDQAEITPLADNQRKYQGRVVYIADMAIKRSGETIIPVHVSIENNDGFLKPNFNVDVTIKGDDN